MGTGDERQAPEPPREQEASPGQDLGFAAERSAMESVTSELSSELLNGIRSYVELPDSTDAIRKVPRAEFLPYLFRLNGKPFSLVGREPFYAMYDNEYVPETIFMTGRQEGKCLSCGILREDSLHPVRKANGSRFTEGDLKLGTCVSSSGGASMRTDVVSHVWKDFSKPMVRLSTGFGNEVVCSREHRILTDAGFVPAGELSAGSRVVVARRCGEFTGRAYMPTPRVALTAYVIGDGSSSPHHVALTNAANEVLDEACSFFPGTYRVEQKPGNKAKSIVWRNTAPIRDWLKEDGLLAKRSWEKFVPDWVFDLERGQTALFLSRLWATDGCITAVNGFPTITYSSTSPRLISDVRALLSKFGILTTLRDKQAKCNGKVCRLAYEIRVVGSESQRLFLDTFDVPGKPGVPPSVHNGSNRVTIPLSVAKPLIDKLFDGFAGKAAATRGRSLYSSGLRLTPKYALSCDKAREYMEFARSLHLESRPEYARLKALVEGDFAFDSVKSVEDVGDLAAFDLETSECHNFVAGGVVVHNSVNLSRSQVLDCISVPGLQLLYVAPLQSQAQRYSALTLNEAIQSCELARQLQSKSLERKLSDSKIMTSVGHQSFANGSGIQLTYAKTSPDRARGIFADRIDFDEIQDQLIDNLPIIAESLTASKWGVRRYTGTAKTVDNTIEQLWQKSSKCEWAMKCGSCGAWNIPNKDGRVLDMIQADGVHCVYCGARLNTRCGEWVPEFPDRMSDFRGYHIPQIVLPAFAEDPVAWAKIVRKVMHQPLPIIWQECLGISHSIGSRLITTEDIKKQCVLPDANELQKWKDIYAYIVSAVDWGGAEQNSFTVHVILGIRADGRIDVLFAQRFIGFDPDDVFVEITRAYRFYGCTATAADYGMGFDKNIILEKRFGINMCQFMFVRQNKLLGYSPSLGHARWTIDKTSALDILFMAIKNGRIYFPPYETFEVYLRELLSPYEVVSENGGLTSRRYLRDPSTPDDFCMALCFGTMLAMKLLYGEDEINVIPKSAFGNGYVPDGAPVDNSFDPKDVLSSMG